MMDLLDPDNLELVEDLEEFQRSSLRALPPGVELDEDVRDVRARALVQKLDWLLVKYPGHPDLLELRGLYCPNSARALDDFQAAIASAADRGYPTFMLRIRAAFELVWGFVDYQRAKAELDAAYAELQAVGSEEQKEEYRRRLRDLEYIREGTHCDCGAFLQALTEPKCPSCGQGR
jgi:hypothetical protein